MQPNASPTEPKARVHGAPIILVSSSPTALITMYNVQRFLGEAVFETSQEARQKAGNSRPPELIHIYRKVDVPSSKCIFFVHIDFSSLGIIALLLSLSFPCLIRSLC